MLCNEFEEQLTDYLDGTLGLQTHQEFAEHAMRCPVCHDLLSDVKNSLVACSASEAPSASAGLEARILLKTMPKTAMVCEDFENYLTDYLDGFLAAPLYHRWERHAALCTNCSELPGQVVRAIGACYTYKQEEMPVPVGLEARILHNTIGNVISREVRASATARLIEWIRGALDPIVSPQLASVATMLLVSIFVLTNTVSADGTIGGLYHASLQLAERTASSASKNPGLKQLAGSVDDLMEGGDANKSNEANKNQNSSNQNSAPNAQGKGKQNQGSSSSTNR